MICNQKFVGYILNFLKFIQIFRRTERISVYPIHLDPNCIRRLLGIRLAIEYNILKYYTFPCNTFGIFDNNLRLDPSLFKKYLIVNLMWAIEHGMKWKLPVTTANKVTSRIANIFEFIFCLKIPGSLEFR